jgi:hypothetical protein
MNPNEMHPDLMSHDSIAEVDDPFGHIKRCLNETVLNEFSSNAAPPHKLQLKVRIYPNMHLFLILTYHVIYNRSTTYVWCYIQFHAVD